MPSPLTLLHPLQTPSLLTLLRLLPLPQPPLLTPRSNSQASTKKPPSGGFLFACRLTGVVNAGLFEVVSEHLQDTWRILGHIGIAIGTLHAQDRFVAG